MPNPKRRFSHQRTALRRTNYIAILPEIEANKQNAPGGDPFKLRNMASPEGYYKGRRLPGYKD